MNTIKLLTLTIILTLTTSTFAQEKQSEQTAKEFVAKAVEAYANCLEVDFNAVKESAIFQVIVMKNRYPEADYNGIVDRLIDLANNGETPAIRYKAHIGTLFLEYPELFEDIVFEKSIEDPTPYFRKMSDELAKDMIVRK